MNGAEGSAFATKNKHPQRAANVWPLLEIGLVFKNVQKDVFVTCRKPFKNELTSRKEWAGF
jgi:hypothetical protein